MKFPMTSNCPKTEIKDFIIVFCTPLGQKAHENHVSSFY